ncbi:MAG: succinate-semialdehyde dehydrogenase / glutarate-semialdehyde dehydrogenase [Frankiales bacterium]|jgi:succinate-semialdehyde dehydrogenase/glutarate-semialdehyde dehydrogenase|nr:succinate-semialdehyde dehydrogenase / glutarate-semialdehyde dehydrogenase [Frankiales bacterium]
MAATPDDERRVIDAAPKQLLIGGRWRDASGGATIEIEDPSTGAMLTAVADATPEDAVAALDAAVAAQDAWAATPPRERGEILRRAFETMVERVDDLALLMTLEMGKPLAESRAEVTYAAEFFRWFSEEASRISGRWSMSPDGSGRLLTMKHPVGPCLLITPWNFPLAMGTRKIGPAIAAGCSMVLKPAQQTPLSMLALAEILSEVGLPDGVCNVVTASSASAVVEPLMSDQRLRKMSFTGSTPVGKKLMEQASKRLLRISMELGGNAPFLVFEDADIDAAVEGAMVAKMRNIGESCVAANRFYVHASIADEFTEKLAERMGALRIGRGTEADADVGPLIDATQNEKVAELVDDAIGKGAKAVVGGAKREGPGHFFEPTVLRDIAPDARLLREEIFGPVAPIVTFETEKEAVDAANSTEFGLVAYVYTRDISRAIRVTEALQTGMVGLNRGRVSNPAGPFGGVKESGFGREGGAEGIEEYLETKYVALEV